jgi:serine/threonine protein kinase
MYEVLHGTEEHHDDVLQFVERLRDPAHCANFAYQMSSALERVLPAEEASRGLENLSSHSILVRGTLPPLLVLSQLPNWKSDEQCRWRAPDVIRGETYGAAEPSVVYTLGMILLEGLTGRLPLWELSTTSVRHSAVFHTHSLNIAREGPMWDLVRSCLNPTPSMRPTLTGIKNTVAALVPGLVASKAELDSQLATLRETPLIAQPEVQPNVEPPQAAQDDDEKPPSTVKSGGDQAKPDDDASPTIMVVTPPPLTGAFLSGSSSHSTRPVKAKTGKHGTFATARTDPSADLYL